MFDNRKAFALSRREDDGAETSTRLAKKGALKAKPGCYSSALLENLTANGWKTKSLDGMIHVRRT